MPKKLISTPSSMTTKNNVQSSIPRRSAGRSETFSAGDAKIQPPNDKPSRTTNGQHDLRGYVVFYPLRPHQKYSKILQLPKKCWHWVDFIFVFLIFPSVPVIHAKK